MNDSHSHINSTSRSIGEDRGGTSIDYLIIGQGISGTLLSYYLLKEGSNVMVIDDGDPAASSKVASGVINPVTGKRLVRTWMFEKLLPFALDTYTAIGNDLSAPLVSNTSILDFHLTREKQEIFSSKLADEKEYLHQSSEDEVWSRYFRFNYAIGQIEPCLLIDLNTMLLKWRQRLSDNDSLLSERFNWSNCEIAPDGITYKHIAAGKIILCGGAGDADNPYFNMLPWSKDKGEALIVSIPGLPQSHIYKQGISIVHWQDDLFWVGATHDWKFETMDITPEFRKQTEEQLNYWLKLPYKVKDHIVARRPANFERKPFVGLHPGHNHIGIFNGMGTKGCSVAPYFAHQFARHLVHNEPLQPDVDIKRFAKILSR